MVSWGIVTCCTAAVTTYQGLIAVRIFLGKLLSDPAFYPAISLLIEHCFIAGITEAGFFPAVIYLLCFCALALAFECVLVVTTLINR